MRRFAPVMLWLALVGLSVGTLLGPGRALAHCDGMDGPVVTSARLALERGEVDRVLVWVQERDEPAIRAAFQRTLAVRRLSGEAKELADLYFFETLVRIHRAGENAPYTGLQPAGRELGPAIPAADRALESGDPGPLLRLLGRETERGVRERFEQARALKAQATGVVAAGRRYIAAYVPFIHYVERLHQSATGPAPGHAEEQPAAEAHAD